MGKHATPEGQPSTSQKADIINGRPTRQNNQDYTARHAAPETTTSDIPHRDGRTDIP
jgi:hypothetical protein